MLSVGMSGNMVLIWSTISWVTCFGLKPSAAAAERESEEEGPEVAHLKMKTIKKVVQKKEMTVLSFPQNLQQVELILLQMKKHHRKELCEV